MQYLHPQAEKLEARPNPIPPRIIIHGGAGNITRDNLPDKSYQQYRHALLSILHRAHLVLQQPHATALDVATYAVSLLEEDPLFNAGYGAVFTRDGTHELEASAMVSCGYIKRGVGVMQVRHAKSPIKLARELLLRGQDEDGGGAQGHCQLAGQVCDRLNRQWGLESVQPSYFWSRRRWDEHRRGLGLEHDDATYERHRREADERESSCTTDALPATDGSAGRGEHHPRDPSWNGKDYLPQGTVGAVVLDSEGTLCVCTSTGGLTNKLAGRIGDTPTLGAGFWAEQWHEKRPPPSPTTPTASWFADCLPSLLLHSYQYSVLPTEEDAQGYAYTTAVADEDDDEPKRRAVAISGTGNGDSFLRTNAARTAAAIARYHSSNPNPSCSSLQTAVTAVAGPHGQLEQSAGDRWGKTGEGEGGMIGIELRNDHGHIVYDHNCGGLFRAWIDDHGHPRFGVFQDEKTVQS